jgi:hypothetical protein
MRQIRCTVVSIFSFFVLISAAALARAGVVTSCDDYGLRTAMAQGGVVTFACDGTIMLTNAIQISANIGMDGAGHHVTIDGEGTNQIFAVNIGGEFAISNLTLINGMGSPNGGAISNMGAATIVNCTFSNNQAGPSFGGYYSTHYGGAIANVGSLFVSGCTFIRNTVSPQAYVYSFGGAIGGYGTSYSFIENSTFYGNTCADGAAFRLLSIAATATIVNCTMADNNGIALTGAFGGLNVINCLLFNNAGGNINGTPDYGVVDGGYNLSSDDSGPLTNLTSLNNANILLGPLTNNGGTTLTMALLPGSMGIDAANDAAAPPIDQRGVSRPFGAHADVGAYESQLVGSFSGILQTATNYSVSDTATNLVITVGRGGGAVGAATVQYGTMDGTAVSGQSYQGVHGTLNFTNDQRTNEIVIPILNYAVIQNSSSFSLVFSNATGAQLGTTETAITIYGGLAGVSLISNSFSTNYDAGNVAITLVRAGNLSNSFSVNYATSNGTAMAGRDYTGASGTATFGPGQTNVAINIGIAPTVRRGSNETINLFLSNPTNAVLLAPSNAVLTIVNTNAPIPGMLSFSNATASASTALGRVIVNVARAVGSDGTVTVHYATANGTAIAGTDYTATSGNLTFADLQQGTESIYIPINLENSGG